MKEALKLALEALCVAVEPKKGKVYAREFEPIDCFAMHEQAITALREALAQPAQELNTISTEELIYMTGVHDGKKKRPWVGLTDKDCKGMSAGDKVVALWAEAKLKEKNT